MNNATIPSIALSLDRFTRVQQFNDWVVSMSRAGYTELRVYIKSDRTYSNACAPIAGVIEYYRKKGIKIRVDCPANGYVRHTRIWNPVSIEHCGESEVFYPLDKVWTYETSEGVNSLVDAFLLAVRKSDLIEQGVITSIEWCMNEVMDNVLQHSESNKGYVMAQIHKQAKLFAFCVFDSGIGFYNSLKGTKYHPEKPIDAITLALQEKITRDDKIGQGNGLWGLSNIVAQSHGSMEISSGGATYSYNHGEIKTRKEHGFTLSKKQGTSYLDVRLFYDREIDIVKSLGGYEPIDYWLENLEGENDSYLVKVAELASGTGTRQSAAKLRNMVLNISNNQKKVVVLDFDGVNLISSSFADEFIGKIISDKGLYFFLSAFKLKNLNTTNSTILNRSVQQRMAQNFFIEQLSSDILSDYESSEVAPTP